MIRRRPFAVLAVTAILLTLTGCRSGTRVPVTPSTRAPASSNATGVPPATGDAPPSDECTNAMYPVAKGSTWSYTITGDVPGTYTRTITDLNAAGFTDQEVFSTGVTRTGKWQCDDGGFLALQPDVATSGSVSSQNLTANFQTTEVSGLTVPAEIVAGATWNEGLTLEGTESINGQDVTAKKDVTLDCIAGDIESIMVPAGTFNAVPAICRTHQKVTIAQGGVEVPTDITSTATVWYASGVGMVKVEEAITNGPKTIIELTAYKIP